MRAFWKSQRGKEIQDFAFRNLFVTNYQLADIVASTSQHSDAQEIYQRGETGVASLPKTSVNR